MKQLSFEHLENLKRQQLKGGPVPNPSVPKGKIGRVKPQAAEILNKLRNNPLSTKELVSIAPQYNARINEIRYWLAKIGETVDCFVDDDGNNYYRIVPLHGSKYQKNLMERQKRV